jgi:uncharacterized protein YdcH (DUF465 family)
MPGLLILKIKDRIKEPLESGYRDILMNLKMSNGHIVEFRLHLKAIGEADAIGHSLYEQARSIEATVKINQGGIPTAEQKNTILQLKQQAKQIYDSAYQTVLNKQ